jgi:hypothetical protein
MLHVQNMLKVIRVGKKIPQLDILLYINGCSCRLMTSVEDSHFMHYDPLKSANIFQSTSVHHFFCKNVGYYRR